MIIRLKHVQNPAKLNQWLLFKHLFMWHLSLVMAILIKAIIIFQNDQNVKIMGLHFRLPSSLQSKRRLIRHEFQQSFQLIISGGRGRNNVATPIYSENSEKNVAKKRLGKIKR